MADEEIMRPGYWIQLVLCVAFSTLALTTRAVPDMRFRLAGYPAIFCHPVAVPAKILTGTG